MGVYILFTYRNRILIVVLLSQFYVCVYVCMRVLCMCVCVVCVCVCVCACVCMCVYTLHNAVNIIRDMCHACGGLGVELKHSPGGICYVITFSSITNW